MREIGGLLLPFDTQVDRGWGRLAFNGSAFDDFLFGDERSYGRDVCWFTAEHRMKFRDIVAREANKTLHFMHAAEGLRWVADIVEASDDPGATSAQRDLLNMVDQRLGLCVSAGTLIDDLEWHNLEEPSEYAEVTKASLFEMSSVPIPAFLQARVEFHSVIDTGVNRSNMGCVMEFASLNEEGRRVAFDFAAHRQKAIEAKREDEPEVHRTVETVAELRERYRVQDVHCNAAG